MRKAAAAYSWLIAILAAVVDLILTWPPHDPRTPPVIPGVASRHPQGTNPSS